jgi:hypothetical protein
MPSCSVAVNYTIKKLLTAGIYPAFLIDRAYYQKAFIFFEFGISAGAIYFRGRGKNNPLMIFDE